MRSVNISQLTAKQLVILAGSGSAVLLMGAFFFQALGYAPCKMCLWQRWPHGIAIVIAGVFWLLPRKALIALGALASAATAGLGAFHTGVERKWWEGPTSCTGGNELTALSATDLLPSAGAAETIVMCDVVSWTFLGLSMASYNFIFASLLTLVWLKALK